MGEFMRNLISLLRPTCSPSLQIKSTAGQNSGYMEIQMLMKALSHHNTTASILCIGVEEINLLLHAFQSHGME